MKTSKFWDHHPALAYGIALLLGTLFALQTPLALLPLPLLLTRRQVIGVTLCFLLPIVYLYHAYTFPPSQTNLSGRFYIQSVREGRGFARGWNYRGVLKTDQGRLHCALYSKERILADRAFTLTATATTRNGLYYTLKNVEWQELPHTFSLAEYRYHAKKWVKNYIARHIPQHRARSFLSGMVTGELEERALIQEFGNLGLSHIMAISGFHFALLTLAFHLILRLILPHKVEAITLMIVLTCYLLFIGSSPSIQRAWIVAMVFLLGQLIERPTAALNSLGVAIGLAVLLNPLSVTTLSFQLSFLATGGILLLYSPLNTLLQLWIPKRRLSDVIEHSFLWQHFYIAGNMMREAFALTLAVHVVLAPYLLYVFHTLSLNSLIYNLFFPFCAGLALIFFLLGVATGGVLHPLNGWYYEQLLKLTESPPIEFKPLYVESLPTTAVALYTITLFTLLIWYYQYQEDLRTGVY